MSPRPVWGGGLTGPLKSLDVPGGLQVVAAEEHKDNKERYDQEQEPGND